MFPGGGGGGGQTPSRSPARGGGSRRGQRGGRDPRMIGRTVRIAQGPFKGNTFKHADTILRRPKFSIFDFKIYFLRNLILAKFYPRKVQL